MSAESDQTTLDTSSSNLVVPDGLGLVYIDPSSLLVSKQITFPPNPSDQQRLRIVFGGSIATGTLITTLTMVPNSGQNIAGVIGNLVLLNITPGSMAFIWRNSVGKWYRLQ